MLHLKKIRGRSLIQVAYAGVLLTGCQPLTVESDASVLEDSSVMAGDPDGPLVEVLTPLEALDPRASSVLVQEMQEVSCRATPRQVQIPINPSSVQITVSQGDEPVAKVTTQAQARGDGTYAATINLVDMKEGPVRFGCIAQDIQGRTGKKEVRSLFDRGPIVTFESPAAGAAFSRNGHALVRFQVSPSPLADGDPGAAVGEVRTRLNGTVVTPNVDAATGTFSLELDLSDPTRFPISVDAVRVDVEADNRRAPAKATRKSSVEAALDGAGPELIVDSPKDSSFVGHKAQISIQLRDPLSGIKAGSVRATVEVDQQVNVFPLTRANATSDVYTTSFQTDMFKGRSQLTVNIVAEDNAGNETRTSRVVFVDDVPPWISLDPPVVRSFQTMGADFQCSAPFDPVGDDAVNDLDVSKSLFTRVRAFIWERGVAGDGQSIVRISDVDDQSVAMYAQSNPSIPLVIDTDQDGTCDTVAVDPAPVGPQNDPVKVAFAPVSPRGAPYPGDSSSANAAPALGACLPSTGPVPQILCLDSPMTYVPAHAAAEIGTVIYALHPSSGSGAGCTGDDWQATGASGWTCFVAAATDVSGNLGISMPLRLCYDLAGNGSACMGPPPSCTDGCTMPKSSSEIGAPDFLFRAN